MEPLTTNGDQADVETARIRHVYEARGKSQPRHPAIVEAYRWINQERLDQMRALVTQAPGGMPPRILDVGCGSGFDLAYWLSAGWPSGSLAGVDLMQERVVQARSRCPGVDVRVTSGTNLPFPDGSFDVATAVTVFSSILDEQSRRALFAEMIRVVRPGGMVLVYDFVVRKPGNRDVIPMDLGRLGALGEKPSGSVRLTPLLHLVAAGSFLGRLGTSIAMRLAPRTHRLTRWHVSG